MKEKEPKKTKNNVVNFKSSAEKIKRDRARKRIEKAAEKLTW